ncbi:MAG: hypothetical protein LBF93_03615 [Zoogloeaceae bacterium]|jgi:hypothetical protein|nr:hypothetical protein [Zoogloeaceae bacterium]
MSLDKPSVHVRLAPEQHRQLSVLAGLADRDMAEVAAEILEQGIVGRFHTVMAAADRMSRLGLTGIDRERKGAP